MLVVDDEKQRELLLTIIRSVPLSGSFSEVEKTVEDMQRLRQSVIEAEIKKPTENAGQL